MDRQTQAKDEIVLITTPIQPLPTSTNDHPQFICELKHLLNRPIASIKRGDTLRLWGTSPTEHNATITGTVGKVVKHEKYMVTIKLDLLNQPSNVTLHLRLHASLLELPCVIRLQRSLESLLPRKTSPPPTQKVHEPSTRKATKTLNPSHPISPLFTESNEVFFERVYTP
jgi:hypothetical protein